MQPSTTPEVCVVERDVGRGKRLCSYLEENGLCVSYVSDLAELANPETQMPRLLLADADSFGCLRSRGSLRLLRSVTSLPVILMSDTALEVDRVVGLEGGADDFIPKSMSFREVLARVRAVLRRTYGAPLAVSDVSAKVEVGDFVFCHASRELVHPERVIVLGRVQAAVLAELTNRPRVAMSRARLAAVAGSMGALMGSRAIDTLIARLRQVIEECPNKPRLIVTVQGAGYMFVPTTKAREG